VPVASTVSAKWSVLLGFIIILAHGCLLVFFFLLGVPIRIHQSVFHILIYIASFVHSDAAYVVLKFYLLFVVFKNGPAIGNREADPGLFHRVYSLHHCQKIANLTVARRS
jgi:hypothetical protein